MPWRLCAVCSLSMLIWLGCEPRSPRDEQAAGPSQPAAAPSPAVVSQPDAATAMAADSGVPDTAGGLDAAVLDAASVLAKDARSDAAPAAPVLFAPDGGPLGQTEDKPSPHSDFFERQAQALFEAIVQDEPALAVPFFFPKVAYEQVKDIAKPGRDWEHRLIGQLERNVHAYHRQLGRHRDEARFVRLEVPMERAKWMKPGSEGNRVGYWRVLRSRLIYLDHEERERSLEVTSFISWRGEWYLVHLHGFK